jgi:hypothetical protein
MAFQETGPESGTERMNYRMKLLWMKYLLRRGQIVSVVLWLPGAFAGLTVASHVRRISVIVKHAGK